MTAANTFSLYLSKSDVLEFDDLLTEAARHRLNGRSARKATSDAIGDGAALYTFAGRRKIPPWAEQLKAHFTLDQDLWTESPCAILVFRKDERLFAITFSYAHVYLDDRRTETDFGLRVAINFVNDDRLRSVERSNIGNAIRDLAQSPDQKDLRSFGFNDVLDLIRKVTGSGSENSFADRVTGAHSLRFSKAIAIDDIPDTAALAVKLFQAAFYKETAFRIIDSLSPISDLSLESSLNEALLEAIRDGSDEFAISLPEILPDHVVSFRFERMHANKFHPDLSLELYRDNLGDRLTTLALEELKHHRVAAYDVNEDRPYTSWPVHHALLGSIVLGHERYALNEGVWYRVSNALKDAADAAFLELQAEGDQKFRPLRKQAPPADKKKRKYYYQSESSYNAEIAKETGYYLLDERPISVEGVAGPGLEACDLLDIEGRRFIHVKESSRRSSVLSHFFKQGSNSAQMIRTHESFKYGIQEMIRTHDGDKPAASFEKTWNDRWTVEFRIQISRGRMEHIIYHSSANSHSGRKLGSSEL